MSFRSLLEKFLERGTHEFEIMVKGGIPLTTSVIKRLNHIERVKAFHLTQEKFIKDLESLQGTKKSISCFTRAESDNIFREISTSPDVLVELEGDKLFHGEQDSWTIMDRQGRRWLDCSILGFRAKNSRYFRIITDDLKNIFENLLEEIIDLEEESSNNRTKMRFVKEYKDYTDLKLTGEQKRQLYIKYNEEVEKYLIKKGITFSDLEDAIGNDSRYDYDEVVLNNIKIKNIWFIYKSELEKDKYIEISKNKFYSGQLSRDDVLDKVN